MNAFDILLLGSTLMYAGGLLFFSFGLLFPNREQNADHPRISVVIAARNEEDTLPWLLQDLKNQSYPENLCEFIIVNDHSEDDTTEVVRATIDEDKRFKLIDSVPDKGLLTPKKQALVQGIRESSGEIILTTDADCRVLPTWIETIVSYFETDVGMVVGFSQLDVPERTMTFLEKLQALDFLSLMTAAQGALNLSRPMAASGQNLAYRRAAFEDAGGFRPIGHRISGDDVLLLQLIHTSTSWKIRFAPSPAGFNTSRPEGTIHALLNQRKRWASNGAYQFKLNKGFFFYILNTFLFNLLLFSHGAYYLFFRHDSSVWLLCLVIKIMMESILAAAGIHVYGRWNLMKTFPVWTILQVPYVIFVGIAGSIGSIEWKSRRHPGIAEKFR